jgi:uncharacterized surface protein with fasciclin (FAS1) repeats
MKINKPFFRLTTAMVTGAVIMLSSCKKDDDPQPVPTNTITDVVVNTASYSVLKEAVVKANLGTTLSGTGPFTVFAPDNTAFSNAGITSATVASLPATQLSDLLLYHTIGAKILAAGVPAGPNAKVVTAGGDSVFVTKNAAGVFVNGIQVAQADIAADNGVIHRLSKALNKPSGNIVQTAVATSGGDNGLDSLVVAVTTAGLGTTLTSNTLTVFAPSNKAFRDLLTALSLPNVKSIPVSTLTAVLTYHVVPGNNGRTFSSDLPGSGSVAMFSGGNTTVNLTGGATIRGNNGVLNLSVNGSTNNTANITGTNIMCRNGVVHLIDRVLLP